MGRVGLSIYQGDLEVDLCGCMIHALDGSGGRRFYIALDFCLVAACLLVYFCTFVCFGAVPDITIPQSNIRIYSELVCMEALGPLPALHARRPPAPQQRQGDGRRTGHAATAPARWLARSGEIKASDAWMDAVGRAGRCCIRGSGCGCGGWAGAGQGAGALWANGGDGVMAEDGAWRSTRGHGVRSKATRRHGVPGCPVFGLLRGLWVRM